MNVQDKIEELESKTELNLDDRSQFTRLIAQKEEHGLKVKEEVRVIWGDYIKAPQIEKFPEVHGVVHQIMMAASKTTPAFCLNSSESSSPVKRLPSCSAIGVIFS